MDQAEWDALVRRWEERDRRWEERDRRWQKDSREHREFMREMWTRIEQHDIRSEARHEELMGQLRALTDATWRMLDRFGEGPQTAG